MLCKTYSATCVGLSVVTITVEVDISNGIGIMIVGLPDNAVRESLTRVLTAIRSYGFRIPGKKIVINLAPADIKKSGSSYDLAITVALLCASEQIEAVDLDKYLMMGELALDGSIRPVTGTLPIADHAAKEGFKGCIFPAASACEAVDIEGVDKYGVANLSDVLEIIRGESEVSRLKVSRENSPEASEILPRGDFADVKGQYLAKRGLEIAAAGGHNIILIGSPGCGKSLMASCLPSILPPMTREESIETSKIYSVSGESIGFYGLMKERPFRAPHNSASKVSLLGGGHDVLPGEISLAHNGVLYLDEIAQFSKLTLDMLRQPLEEGRITISRARYKAEFPCSFMLVASMNPCPCGYYGDKSQRCSCSQAMISSYLSRISGPLLDRIDMHIFVERVSSENLTDSGKEESSSVIARRVTKARIIQQERFKGEAIFTNARMTAPLIAKYCQISPAERTFLANLIDKLQLSARAYSRILKLARTIADLEGLESIDYRCISEAVQFRNLDRLKSFY
ncbi:MAG: YifB family Mg chelatase-like AAA ATPase [Bacteroidales bacterium]|nr:YifB family Mg chelatase-like AAA ATPase [Bacteroidales bacterium]